MKQHKDIGTVKIEHAPREVEHVLRILEMQNHTSISWQGYALNMVAVI